MHSNTKRNKVTHLCGPLDPGRDLLHPCAVNGLHTALDLGPGGSSSSSGGGGGGDSSIAEVQHVKTIACFTNNSQDRLLPVLLPLLLLLLPLLLLPLQSLLRLVTTTMPGCYFYCWCCLNPIKQLQKPGYVTHLCGMAWLPSLLSGRNSSHTPNSFLKAQWLSLGSQLLNSPTRASALAPGALQGSAAIQWQGFGFDNGLGVLVDC
jgi:hypothetical protein